MATERIRKTERFLHDQFAASAHLQQKPEERNYRIEHSYRVANIARTIAKGEGMDEEALVIAALLHDISYCEPMETREAQLGHGRASARISRPFLESIGLPEATIQEICYGIAIHVDDEADFAGERTPFALSVGDADNIDRFDAYRIYETLEWKRFSSLDLAQKRCEVSATLERLKKYQELPFATQTATDLWVERLSFYTAFYNRLSAQLSASDGLFGGPDL